MQKHINKYYPRYATFSDYGSHFEQICVIVSRCGAFFARPLVRNLWKGTPLDRFWYPLGHPWSDFIDLLEDFRSKSAPNFKDSRATNGTNHTLKKTSKDKQINFTDRQSKQIIFYFYCLTPPRKSEAPSLKQIRVGGTPEGIKIVAQLNPSIPKNVAPNSTGNK